MLYEIHMLKNYPPVNLNRDESGSSKVLYVWRNDPGPCVQPVLEAELEAFAAVLSDHRSGTSGHSNP